MTNHSVDLQLRKTARIAGIWYLALAIVGLFCVMYVPKKIIVPGNAEATVNKIMANEMLFRFGILGDLISLILFVITVLCLYRLFKEVNLRYAQLMVALVLASVLIAFPFELSNVAILVFLSGPGYLSAFSTSQLQALTMFFVDLSQQSTFIGEIFWGLWLIPLAILVYRSRFLPRFLGVWLLINGFAYLVLSFTSLLLPRYEGVVSNTAWPAIFGEFAFILWLLIKGAKMREPEARPAGAKA